MYIREATVDDTARIHDIGSRSYRYHFTTIWTPKGLEKHLEAGFSQAQIQQSLHNIANNTWFLVSESPTASPMGFATLIKNSPIPHSDEKALELQKLYFLPGATGQGNGNHLLAFIFNFAKENAYQKIWLDVLKSNSGAIQFYKKHGFTQIGELPFKTDKIEVGQWVMVKTL